MKKFFSNNLRLALITPILFAALVMAYYTAAVQAASASLSFSPATASATVGNKLVVAVHENSGSTAINGVTMSIQYPADKLKFVSADNPSPFVVAPPDSANNGTLSITRGSFSGVTGSQTVTNITFTVLAAGTATVTFDTNSTYMANASDGSHVPYTATSGSYTLSSIPVSGGGGSTGGSSGGSSSGSGSGGTSTGSGSTSNPLPAPAPHTGSKSGSVKVSTSDNTAVTVPDGGSFSVTQPVNLQPATVQTDGVEKIEYYINGKLVDTETVAPYIYHIDTKGLKNGTYKVEQKTYYNNGQVKSNSYQLIADNPSSGSILGAVLKWIIIAVIILGVVFYVFRRRGGKGMLPYSAPLPTSYSMPSGDVYSGTTVSSNPAPAYDPSSSFAPVNGVANAPAEYAEDTPGMVYQPFTPGPEAASQAAIETPAEVPAEPVAAPAAEAVPEASPEPVQSPGTVFRPN